jgi:hypothetical protein
VDVVAVAPTERVLDPTARDVLELDEHEILLSVSERSPAAQ